MATFEKLSAEQRAIIELVLQRGKTYPELADLLAMPEARVRDLARDALVSLAPVTVKGVDDEWRGQLADYVLGQQSGPESTATRGHLRRSEPARAWARSLLDSLDTLYDGGGGMPTIPDGDRPAARERRPRRRDRERDRERERPAEPVPPRRELSPAAQAAVRQRRLVAGGAAAAIALLFIVLVWPIGVLTGGDEDKGGSSGGGTAATPQPGQRGVPAGVAIVAERGGKRQVIVQAASLPPNRNKEAYEVWLYNSPKDAQSLGAQVTDSRGTFQGAGPLPEDYQRFKYIDVSREPIDQNRSHSGQSVLRGTVGKLKPASQGVKRGQATILGQVVLTPPKSG
jgi:hypothetical protein